MYIKWMVLVIFLINIPNFLSLPLEIWTESDNFISNEFNTIPADSNILPLDIFPKLEIDDNVTVPSYGTSTNNGKIEATTNSSRAEVTTNNNRVELTTNKIRTETATTSTWIEEKEHKSKDVEEITEVIGINKSSISTTTSKPTSTTQNHFANQEDVSEEEESSEEEEELDIVQSLISMFLGGLSTPEGGVDVDAVVGLIGGLSVPNDDGTYDFGGLTDTLQSILGAGAENGGSNVGAFLGGLLGAFLQGIAVPPGSKGVGVVFGNLLGTILPGLSAPAPPPEDSEKKPEQGLDSAGFFHGLIKGSSDGSNSGNNMQGNGNSKPLSNVKQTFFKAVFSLISSVFTKPSKSNWK